MKFCLSHVNGWNWRPLVRLTQPKHAFSPLYVHHRLKTNPVISLDIGHTLRRECAWEREGNQKLECV
jgi:hypothetical protein